MAITRYAVRSPSLSAWRDLEEASNRLTRFFDGSSRATNGRSWTPAVNVEETDDALLLTTEVPGLTEEDISIELENNTLTISGEKREERTEGDEERRYHLWERRFGAFKRTFTLPRTVKGDDIRASVDNGILKVRMPKVAEAKSRKIAIEKA